MLFKLITEFLYYILPLIAQLRLACLLTKETTKLTSMANCKRGKLTIYSVKHFVDDNFYNHFTFI